VNHHPIVGGAAATLDAPSDLVISTEVCPHCGKPRRSVAQYHKSWKDGTRPWMITWACGSSVILAEKPVLSIARNCGTLWT
jgi:hypothetical protein